MLDRDMRYLQVSNRWCADFSLDSSQLLGRSHYEIFPDLPERWRQIHRRCLEGETFRAEEDPWDRADGTTWLRWEIRPWQNLDGVPGGILIFSEDITHRKQAEEALVSLSGRLIEAQDEERKRIAREIHDDYSQRVALLALELERLAENEDSSGETSQKFHELFDRVSELGTDLHSLSHRLHSSTLESLGLRVGLQVLCKEFEKQQGMQVDFVHENISRGVPADAALCMFRIAQEALRNTKRHSGANRAEVRLEQLEGRLHLSVSDCGRGFNSNRPTAERGIGIHSMEERLRHLGGELQIQSRPMEGTRIDAWLPLKMASAA
jgi:PAS domain S-box-containing protein